MKTTLITLVLILLVAIEPPLFSAPAYSAGTQTTQTNAPNLVVTGAGVFAACLLIIGGWIFWQLWKLCNRIWPSPPKSPPPKNPPFTNAVPKITFKGGEMPPIISQTIRIPLTPTADNIWKITNNTPDLVDDSGTNYYNGIATFQISSTTNMVDYRPEGSAYMWFNEKYMVMGQYTNDVLILSNTFTNWITNTITLTFQCPQAEQRFFKVTPINP
jgi:hypothetical protein